MKFAAAVCQNTLVSSQQMRIDEIYAQGFDETTTLSMFTTVMLSVENSDATDESLRNWSGTGFFYTHQFENGEQRELLVTAKHNVEDSTDITLYIREADHIEDRLIPSSRNRLFELSAAKPFENGWVAHPDEQIDLCAFDASEIRGSLATQMSGPAYFMALGWNTVLPESELPSLKAAEPVIMPGYPVGLYDERNHLPLIRSGHTASHPAIDYGGQPIGVIDIAAWTGSSGSPVMIPKASEDGKNILLGVLANVEELDLGDAISPVETPVGLGYYVKARELITLASHVRDQYR
jgi:hypothetical protein